MEAEQHICRLIQCLLFCQRTKNQVQGRVVSALGMGALVIHYLHFCTGTENIGYF